MIFRLKLVIIHQQVGMNLHAILHGLSAAHGSDGTLAQADQ